MHAFVQRPAAPGPDRRRAVRPARARAPALPPGHRQAPPPLPGRRREHHRRRFDPSAHRLRRREPADLAPAAPRGGGQSIEDKLRGTAARFHFRSTWGAGPDDLLDTLVDASPDILHFAGHGGTNGALLLQTADGGAHPVAPAALAKLIAARPWRPRLVVLNCCYSAILANALRPHVDAVVGMRGEVPDEAARQFAVQLYRALAQRDSLATAFDTARAALMVHNLAADHLPQLTVRSDVDPHRYRLF
ncbi:CHAT domain-containing protein [Nannocystis pusilla]|uniref:CHAT domain-containing protein n=1 Tax=Nannocystis pusilla TaxID=889268 RepID=UPI003B77BF0C